MTLEHLAPLPGNRCFGCGGANPRGLQLRFELDHEHRRIRSRLRLSEDFQGSHRMAHGGIIALLLDEAMGKLNRLHNVRAVTAEMTVEYLRPVPVEEEIEIVAEEVAREGRNLLQRGEIRGGNGKVLARARARFVAIAEREAAG